MVYNVCGRAEVGVDTDALPVADWWSCGRGDLTKAIPLELET